jgi:hypothetical protein
MSTRQCRALVLSLVFAFSLAGLPASATTRDGGSDRGFAGIVKMVKRIVKRVILPDDDTISLPKP